MINFNIFCTILTMTISLPSATETHVLPLPFVPLVAFSSFIPLSCSNNRGKGMKSEGFRIVSGRLNSFFLSIEECPLQLHALHSFRYNVFLYSHLSSSFLCHCWPRSRSCFCSCNQETGNAFRFFNEINFLIKALYVCGTYPNQYYSTTREYHSINWRYTVIYCRM